ncbi:hypothetical protein R1flu_012139 [Riccia fluitans]|uniref:Ribosomal protein L2 n=1 Tax=Riccia fluitans TaxID=41844 RepID=A0ABD1ZDW4_9MARC
MSRRKNPTGRYLLRAPSSPGKGYYVRHSNRLVSSQASILECFRQPSGDSNTPQQASLPLSVQVGRNPGWGLVEKLSITRRSGSFTGSVKSGQE